MIRSVMSIANTIRASVPGSTTSAISSTSSYSFTGTNNSSVGLAPSPTTCWCPSDLALTTPPSVSSVYPSVGNPRLPRPMDTRPMITRISSTSASTAATSRTITYIDMLSRINCVLAQRSISLGCHILAKTYENLQSLSFFVLLLFTKWQEEKYNGTDYWQCLHFAKSWQ